MSRFSPEELEYLTTAKVLGRLATVDHDGHPHLVPVGWHYNPDLDTIDISGREFARTKKFRNAKNNPRVAFLVDEVLPPWRPRAVMVQGTAEALDGDHAQQARIHIVPDKIISWGLSRGPATGTASTSVEPDPRPSGLRSRGPSLEGRLDSPCRRSGPD